MIFQIYFQKFCQDCSELQLFNIAKRWLKYDYENRRQYAARIMENIRFPLIAPHDLIQHVQVACDCL